MEPARGSWLLWKHMHFSICRERLSFDWLCTPVLCPTTGFGRLLTALNTLKNPACQSLGAAGRHVARVLERGVTFCGGSGRAPPENF